MTQAKKLMQSHCRCSNCKVIYWDYKKCDQQFMKWHEQIFLYYITTSFKSYLPLSCSSPGWDTKLTAIPCWWSIFLPTSLEMDDFFVMFETFFKAFSIVLISARYSLGLKMLRLLSNLKTFVLKTYFYILYIDITSPVNNRNTIWKINLGNFFLRKLLNMFHNSSKRCSMSHT